MGTESVGVFQRSFLCFFDGWDFFPPIPTFFLRAMPLVDGRLW